MFYFFFFFGCIAGVVSVGRRVGRCILFVSFGVNLLHMFEYSVGKANVSSGFSIANELRNEYARASASAPFFTQLYFSFYSNDTI